MMDETGFVGLFSAVRRTCEYFAQQSGGGPIEDWLDDAEAALLKALKSGQIVADGFPLKAGFSAAGQTRRREPVPIGDWEQVTTSVHQHHDRERIQHLVSYIDTADPSSEGSLTYHGEASPSWRGLRVVAADLDRWLGSIRYLAEPEASWTADQALIWIATRRPGLVAQASRRRKDDRSSWVTFPLVYEGTWIIEREDAEAQLLADLQHGRLAARVGLDALPREWLMDAKWAPELPSREMMSMALVMKGEPQLVGHSADGLGKFYARHEDEARIMIDAAELRLLYPMPAEAAFPTLMVKSGPPTRTERKPKPSEIEASLKIFWAEKVAGTLSQENRPGKTDVRAFVRTIYPSASDGSIDAAWRKVRSHTPEGLEIDWSVTGVRGQWRPAR